MFEFKAFPKILHVNKLYMSITQKIHGTNAQIFIWKQTQPGLGNAGDIWHIVAGSRTRWLTIQDDNYGFCRWVVDNQDQIIAKLGEGRHYGEWAGPGINSGEGLKEKTFLLFNWRRFIGKELPNRVSTVPLLYNDRISLDAINEAMDKLKTQGSMLVPGYMKPEGIVIDIDGQLYKNVFDDEEVKWKSTARILGDKVASLDVSYLFQPLRLEKLLSKDETYARDYPSSLGRICKDYVMDLEEEKQFKAQNEDDLKAEKKALGKEIFYFVKSIMKDM